MQTSRYQVALDFECRSAKQGALIAEGEELLREELCTGILSGRSARSGWKTLSLITSIPQACVFEAARRLRWVGLKPQQAFCQMVLGLGDDALRPVGPVTALLLEPPAESEWDPSRPSHLTRESAP